MSRAFAMALSVSLLSSAAVAAQLVGPNFNPGLKTVPWTHTTAANGFQGKIECIGGLADRIDSGTIASGPQGMVAHVIGMASLGSEVALHVASVSPDGRTAEVEFLACDPYVYLHTPAPAAANLKLDPGVRTVRIRASANDIVLHTADH